MPKRNRPTALLLAGLAASTLLFAACDPEPEPGTPSPIVTVPFRGPVASILGDSSLYQFAGPAADIETTASAPKVTGVASAQLGFPAGTGDGYADVGMCWQLASGGVLTNFYGGYFSQARFSGQRSSYSASASVVLAPNAYRVGMCVRNNSPYRLSNNNFVNGWVQVTA